MALELSQEELDLLEREQQLEETINAFRQVMERFSQDNSSREVVEAIQTNSKLITDLVASIGTMKFEMKQEDVVVSTMRDNYNTLTLALAEIKKSNDTLLEAVNKLTEATTAEKVFTPKYGQFNRLESITVTTKK